MVNVHLIFGNRNVSREFICTYIKLTFIYALFIIFFFLQNIGCVANFLFISAVELQKRFTFEMGIESYFLIIELYVVVDFLRRNSKKGF